MQLKCEVKTKSTAKRYIRKLEKKLPNAMEELMQHAKKVALEHKRGSKDENLILFEIRVEGNKVKARLYTNFDYAMFLEYGTGTEAKMPHIGKTKTFLASRYRYWFLPKEVADSKGREFTNKEVINIKGKLFYLMTPQEAHPFMQPTAFDLENNAARIFGGALIKELGK